MDLHVQKERAIAHLRSFLQWKDFELEDRETTDKGPVLLSCWPQTMTEKT